MSTENAIEASLKKLEFEIQKLQAELKKKKKVADHLLAALKEIRPDSPAQKKMPDAADSNKIETN